MPRILASLLLACSLAAPALLAQSPDETPIRAALSAQAEAWNRADIPGFMQAYEESAETTFIGATVRKGFKPILERYRQAYGTAEEMGKLTFTAVEVRLLPSACGPSELALVTGRYHLARTARGEATKDDGVFSLVWRKTAKGWKIILDHSS
ncbi:MAG: nuclear transport factor 2 family protein [Terracidiphilus sp.]